MAIGIGPERGVQYLYIGDIGDIDRNRKSIEVYRVPEPEIGGFYGKRKLEHIATEEKILKAMLSGLEGGREKAGTTETLEVPSEDSNVPSDKKKKKEEEKKKKKEEEEDCLLYTSPSPRDRTRSRMPSSA